MWQKVSYVSDSGMGVAEGGREGSPLVDRFFSQSHFLKKKKTGYFGVKIKYCPLLKKKNLSRLDLESVLPTPLDSGVTLGLRKDQISLVPF